MGSFGDALQYLRAGADLVQVGTQSFADPRASLRIIRGLARVDARGELPPGRDPLQGAGRPALNPSAPRSHPAAEADRVGVQGAGVSPAVEEVTRG